MSCFLSIVKGTDEKEEEGELDEQEQKSYETIQKMIEGLPNIPIGSSFSMCVLWVYVYLLVGSMHFSYWCFVMMAGGQVDRLKVEHCKIYLRKHGLRLSGNKETLILRIKEHIE